MADLLFGGFGVMPVARRKERRLRTYIVQLKISMYIFSVRLFQIKLLQRSVMHNPCFIDRKASCLL